MVLGIRHGLVANPGHVVYARLPGFGLAPEGREAAADLARTLARAPVAAVVASPLERAVETAEILAAPHGLPVSTDERLSMMSSPSITTKGLSPTCLRATDTAWPRPSGSPWRT